MKKKLFHNFFGLNPSFEKAQAAIIQAPLEVSESIRAGSAAAPQAILRASQRLSRFDYESENNFEDIGIVTYGLPNFEKQRIEEALSSIKNNFDDCHRKGLWPILLGGEQISCLAGVQSLKERTDELGVIYIDALPDFLNFFEGSELNRFTAYRRIIELCPKSIHLGARDFQKEEWESFQDERFKGISTEQALSQAFDESLKCLPDQVFVSLDFNILSSTEIRGVSHPVPNGITYKELLGILSQIFERKEVLGVGLCELCPEIEVGSDDVFAANLVKELLKMQFFRS